MSRRFAPVILLAAAACGWAQPKPPATGMEDFRFPNPHVARWRDALATQPREAERALRRHAWQLLYRLSRPGPPDGCPELGWECWITAEQLFSPQPPPRLRMLQVPRQAEVNTGPRLLLSAIYYNEPAEATIRQGWNSPARVAAWARAGQSGPDFPPAAIVVKPIWGVVPNVGAKSTLCLPLWSSRQKDPHGTGDGRVEFGQFPGGVLVQYPPGAKDSFLGCTVEGRLKRYPRPITASRFPHHRLTVQEAAFASKAAEVPLGGRGLREGDYLILLGVHIITREVPDWLWTTFWWTPEPKHEPFASDQIAAISRDPVWRHFALDVAADTDLPQAAGRKDGKAHKVAFNPYLEAPQRQGTYTNCLSCHARSLWVAPGDRRDLMRGAEPFGPDELPGALRTRFLWSIVLRNAWQAP